MNFVNSSKTRSFDVRFVSALFFFGLSSHLLTFFVRRCENLEAISMETQQHEFRSRTMEFSRTQFEPFVRWDSVERCLRTDLDAQRVAVLHKALVAQFLASSERSDEDVEVNGQCLSGRLLEVDRHVTSEKLQRRAKRTIQGDFRFNIDDSSGELFFVFSFVVQSRRRDKILRNKQTNKQNESKWITRTLTKIIVERGFVSLTPDAAGIIFTTCENEREREAIGLVSRRRSIKAHP